MASCATIETANNRTVGMGQVAIAQGPVCLTAILGSCIAIALYHKRLQLGSLCHVVLPASNGHTNTPGKFADTAVPHIIALLKEQGATRVGVTAKLAGGACMFGIAGPLQIGEANEEAILRQLHAAGIRIVGKDLGGTNGRRISFDCGTGMLTIETVGNPPRTLQ